MSGPGGLSRRSLFAALGTGAAGAGLIGAGAAAAAAAREGDGRDDVVPFHGEHQAGIATSVQGHLHFAAFDVLAEDRAELAGLLRDWTRAAVALCAGREVGEGGAAGGSPSAPPSDTGEAQGLGASRLTLTVGFGPSLFDDRFGLGERRPEALVELPAFRGDALEEARCGGDLAVQACADDPQVAVHAIRTLTRLAAGRAAVRWAQLGYGRAASVDPDQPTPRNLFGFKDGTANPAGSDAAALDEHVWVAAQDAGDEARAWMTGGSYLVARRVAMRIETWDRAPLAEQEAFVGRTKGEGAPLGGTAEHEAFDPATLPASSHVRLAHPSRHGGARMLRRGFSYTGGTDGYGHLDAGLFFLAYQRDVRRAFVPVQTALAEADALGEYLVHTGSGVWAVPPGVREGGWWGETLLA
ncbi:iron uptake transporter deferrochelatase/peroxidase subunit [Quadrisphaera sp. DSM 44207]|uniref:iron uptake transporter deferrochelatase/peroxidase subunit n=1 Tax=Quadrisphaera sp. DSM 44207 TaxID=1881057 RepID=UPI00088DF459|nr:iron uptake transporter deferrochelatase/peroxidase subunit [Quadrisphaera sp. DSM 44207]SDQ49630.1 deferrochelatase/peroxidase EfeB [Quadrisphaera sp. DSM 44207]